MTGEQKDRVAWVHEARKAASKTFRVKWDQMQENSKFIRLQQYSQDQLNKFSDSKRVPYVLDYINSSINTYQGIQRDKRTEIFYYPSEPGDEVKCEVLNSVKDSSLNENNFVYIESDVFKDGLIEKVGAVSYEWSTEKNKNGSLLIRKVPPRQLMWDLNSREFDKSDASWVSRHRLYTKRDLINRYPARKKDIEKMAFWSDETDSLGLDPTYLQEITDKDLGVVALIEFYEKEWKRRYFCSEKKTGYIKPEYYDTQKDAEAEIKDRLAKYEALVPELQAQGQPVPPPPEYEVIADNFPVIHKTEVALDQYFDDKVIQEPFYPLDFYHPFEHDGDWWCPVDVLKDGQKFFNKMFSMADHWISSMSKGLLLGNSSADKKEQDRVKAAFSTTGGFVEVSDPKDYTLFESKGPAPQLFTLLDLSRQNLEDNSGGRNFMGKKETASESGIAVRTRIEQGGLSGFIVYDNLRRWKMSVGKKLAWYLTHYMTAPQVVRIEGEEFVQDLMQKLSQDESTRTWFKRNTLRPGVGFLEVNTVAKNTLENLQVDCVVDEARWSISKNQSILTEVNMALQSNPTLAGVFPPEAMVEFMNLPFSVKQEALVRMKELEERNAQLEQLKAIKPPAVSASLKDVLALPPQTASEFMAKYFGIQMDASQMGKEEQAKGVMDLLTKKADMEMDQQKHDQSMQMNAEKHAQDLQAKGAKAKLDMEAKRVLTLHSMKMKERTNGDASKE